TQPDEPADVGIGRWPATIIDFSASQCRLQAQLDHVGLEPETIVSLKTKRRRSEIAADVEEAVEHARVGVSLRGAVLDQIKPTQLHGLTAPMVAKTCADPVVQAG